MKNQNNWQNYLKILSKLIRIRTVVVVYLFFIIGYLITASRYSFNIDWVIGFVAVSIWYINATSINDLADEEIDKINLKNDKERPLVDSNTNRSAVKKIYYASALLVLLVCAFFGVKAIILGALMLVLNYIYSMPPIRVSYRGIWAPLTLPLGYVLYPYLLGFFASGNIWQNRYYILLLGLYFAFVGRIFLKDYRDVKGDKKFGKLTFLVRHGNRATTIASAVFWLLGAGLVGLYFKNYWTVLAMVVVFAVAVLYFLHKLSKTDKFSQQQWWLTAVGRSGNIVALVIIFVLDSNIRNISGIKFNLGIGLLLLLGVYYLRPVYVQLKANKAI